jgi:hypothetical protein
MFCVLEPLALLIFERSDRREKIAPHPYDFCPLNSTFDIKVGFKNEEPQETISELPSSAHALFALFTKDHTTSQSSLLGTIEEKSDGFFW